MSQWSGAHRAYAVEAYFCNEFSLSEAQRKFCNRFEIHRLSDAPSIQLIKSWVEKFRATGCLLNHSIRPRNRPIRSIENIDRVAAAVAEHPRRSVRKHAASLNLHRSSVHRILALDLKLHPFKIQIVQKIKPEDYNKRKIYCQKMLEIFSEENGMDNVYFSDESHFHLEGYVNRQNCRYWSSSNPKQKHQKALHSPKVTVWCAISPKKIIGPFFFEDDRGATVTVTSERYIVMINNFFVPQLQEDDIDVSDVWFQQDGATAHTARVSMDTLKALFPRKIISRYGDILWPPRSPDLSPADFFLWGYLKARVFDTSLTNLEQLKTKITTEVRAISVDVLQRVSANSLVRFEECIRRDGRHLDGVIFRT